MVNPCTALIMRTRDWCQRAAGPGWFDEADCRRLETLERTAPEDLFGAGAARPLVIALFGGTGVGKSSLLNRLAGEELARVGVERPTSREATIYVHEAVALGQLPAELPVDRVRVKRHRSDAYEAVLWIDAPDIDSVDEGNRQCALAWLPHVDLVCYVVSPERYRDDAGWRVLRARKLRHGWMFVMNRWDEGDLRQRADFLQMLRNAGFDDPLLLCTSCLESGEPLPSPDEFGQIRQTIRMLIDGHAVQELSRLGQRARLQELRSVLEYLAGRLGDDQRWEQLGQGLRTRWEGLRKQLLDGSGWALQTAASRFAVRERGLLRRVGEQVAELRGSDDGPGKRQKAGPDTGELAALTAGLWDEWSESRIARLLDGMEVATDQAGIGVAGVRRRLDKVGAQCRPTVLDAVQEQVRAALLRPGALPVRVARRVTGFLMSALPLAAVAAVAWQVVRGYWRGSHGESEYLGWDFAINSGLLVLVAWGVPFLVDRLLRPSVEAAVLRAMRHGLATALEDLGEQMQRALRDARLEAGGLQGAGRELALEAAGMLIKPIDVRNPALARVIGSARGGQEAEPRSAGAAAGS